MMNSPLIQKSSVAAAKINQPKLADILYMNQRVRRDTFDDSNTMVLASARPSEQLPLIG